VLPPKRHLPQCRRKAKASWSQRAAHPPVEGGHLRAGAIGGGEGEAIGQADPAIAVAGGCAGVGGVGSYEPNAERGDRTDRGSHCLLIDRWSDQGLGVVNRAEQELRPLGGVALEGRGGRGVVSVPAIKSSNEDVGIKHAASHA
jgi:hypothetical protein